MVRYNPNNMWGLGKKEEPIQVVVYKKGTAIPFDVNSGAYIEKIVRIPTYKMMGNWSPAIVRYKGKTYLANDSKSELYIEVD